MGRLRRTRRRHQEQVVRGHREIIVPDGGAERRDRRAGRRIRRLEPLRAPRASCVLLQLLRARAVQGRRRRPAARRRPPGARGVRLRRRRPRQGRHGHALRRRHQVGEGRVDATVPMAFSADETADVGNDTGTPVTDDLARGQDALHRPGQLGPARHRRRRRGRRPPDHGRRALPDRDGAPIVSEGPATGELVAAL